MPKSKRKYDTSKLPPLRRLPIFVQYVAVRRIRFNPSFAGFDSLGRDAQNELWKKWARRRKQEGSSAVRPDNELSLPPSQRKR